MYKVVEDLKGLTSRQIGIFAQHSSMNAQIVKCNSCVVKRDGVSMLINGDEAGN
jgi:hypothetical protein